MKRVMIILAITFCLGPVNQTLAYQRDLNIAPDGTATQSTDLGGYPASYAIDRNSKTFAHTEDTGNEWWEVDLLGSFNLDRVEIVNRDSYNERITGAVVKILDAARTELFVSAALVDNGPSGVFVFDNAGAGFENVRYVRVEQTTNYLTLAEVRAIIVETADWLTMDSNLMEWLDMEATQVSTAWEGLPEYAIDGDLGTYTHTGNTPDGWWEVDMTQEFAVGRLEIVNRPDSSPERMTNLTVRILNTHRTTAFSYLITESYGLGETVVFDLPAGTQGQYVRVALEDGASNPELDQGITYYISLTEVRAIGGTVIGQACNPNPPDGAVEIPPADDTLSWSIGEDPNNPGVPYPGITGHMVYFGTDADAVFNATSSTTGTYKGTLDPAMTTFPAGDLSKDTTYYWRIDERLIDDANSIRGQVWSFTTELSLPEITAQPEDAFVVEGADVQFTVAADDPLGGTLAYQWYKVGEPDVELSDGADYAGTATDTLTVYSVESADEGSYYCKLTNATGSKVSDAAELVMGKLIGHWPFDGDLKDVAGGNDGSTGDPNFAPGIVGGDGQAVVFFGLTIPSDPVIVPTTAYTIGLGWSLSWWENSDPNITGGAWETMIGCGEGPDGWEVFEFGRQATKQYAFGFNTGGIEYYLWTPNDYSYPRGFWHHHVVAYEPATGIAVWYIDGIKVNEFENIGFTAFDTVFYIGDVRGLSQPYAGLIDDLRLYNYALDATQVGTVYSDVVGPYCAVRPEVDLDGDCISGLGDIAMMVSEWLECGKFPATECP